MPQPRILRLQNRADRGPLRIVGVFRVELGNQDMALCNLVGGRRTEPRRASRSVSGPAPHDHVAGVKIGMAQHVIGREVLDQREDAGGDAFRKHAAGEL